MADESKTAAAAGENQEWQLASYPEADVTVDHMALVGIDMPEEVSADGNVLLKAQYISVDPYMRGQMRKGPSYTTSSFSPGAVMKGFGIAQVLKSRDPDLKEGDVVHGFFPWRRVFEYPGAHCRKLDLSMTPGFSPSVYLGVLGLTGLSAYFPIMRIAEPKEGDVVFVSGAAGAVGSVAGQIFKLKGCRVIGSAGTDEKVQHVKDLGFDDAFNYKTADAKEVLTRFSPEGYNIYWDNVGGPMLDLMLTLMAKYGRIVACGMISQYNKTAEERYGLKNIIQIVGKEVRMQGFIVNSYRSDFTEGSAALGAWLVKGKLSHHETVVEGFGNVAEALVGLFKGANTGKMVVKV